MTLRRFGGGTCLDDVLAGRVSVDEAYALLTLSPRTSPLWAAVYADPEFEPAGALGEVPLSDYSPEAEAIAAVHDEVQALRRLVHCLFAQGPHPEFTPYRRPGDARRATAHAADDAEASLAWDAIVAQLIPEWGGAGVLPGRQRFRLHQA